MAIEDAEAIASEEELQSVTPSTLAATTHENGFERLRLHSELSNIAALPNGHPTSSTSNVVTKSDTKGDASSSLLGSHHTTTAASPRRTSKWLPPTIFTDTWLLEVVFMTLCICSSIEIAVLLKLWSGKEVPGLKLGLNVNAVISILATTAKSAMIFVVSACLAQAKWSWFRHSRPLKNIQTFDDASRGPLGASSLLFDRTLLSMASLGAAITILALAYDPFVQQAVVYPLKPVPFASADSTILQSSGFSQTLENNPEVRNSLLDALWSTNFEQTPKCASSNCTWSLLDTVSLCQKCQSVKLTLANPWNWEEVINRLNGDDDYTNPVLVANDGININISLNESSYEYPPTWSNNEVATFQVLQSGPDSPIPKSWLLTPKLNIRSIVRVGMDEARPWKANGVDDPLLAFAITDLHWTQAGPEMKNSTLCILDPCVQQYSISVTNNQPQSQLKSERFGTKTKVNDTLQTWCWQPEGANEVHYVRGDGTRVPSDCFYDLGTMAFCWPKAMSSNGLFPFGTDRLGALAGSVATDAYLHIQGNASDFIVTPNNVVNMTASSMATQDISRLSSSQEYQKI